MKVLKLPDLTLHCSGLELKTAEDGAGFEVRLFRVHDESIEENADELAAVLDPLIEQKARDLLDAREEARIERRFRRA